MVLRGTATKPESSVIDLRREIRETAELLKAQASDLQESNVQLKNMVEELLDEKEGQGGSTVGGDKELTMALKLLIQRVEDLEGQVHTLKGKKKTAESNFQKTLKQLLCGGLAGGCARTIVAPIDRIKILMQTGFLLNKGSEQKSIVTIARQILQEEGIQKFWRGNGVNCIRVFPYAAIQFVSYEKYKEAVQGWLGSEKFGLKERLLSGSLAGATAASVTHPLDVMRVRLATQRELTGFKDCIASISKEGGLRGFYKGYVPTVMSLAPFIAVNFSTFDYLKSNYSGDNPGPLRILGLGGVAGLTAQTICYPLDTIRRRMQIKGTHYTSVPNAFATIFSTEGPRGFYKGMLPNAIKVVPNNGIRFLAYTYLTKWMGVTNKYEKRAKAVSKKK